MNPDRTTTTVADLVALARVRELIQSGQARAIRVAAGLTLGEVAAALGVSPSTPYRWECGLRIPRGAAGLRYLSLLDEVAKRPVGNGARS